MHFYVSQGLILKWIRSIDICYDWGISRKSQEKVSWVIKRIVLAVDATLYHIWKERNWKLFKGNFTPTKKSLLISWGLDKKTWENRGCQLITND